MFSSCLITRVPASLREHTRPFLGSENLPFGRYTSREFHEREVAKMWPKTWQMVCRETQLANTGDYFVYDITRYSLIVVRTANGLRAFHNCCLHRGRMLKRGTGNASELRCPYHSFAWDMEGGVKGAPCMWDFEHIDSANFRLPEARVDTWGGWVFVNMDRDAPPLHEYLGIIPQRLRALEAGEPLYLGAHRGSPGRRQEKLIQGGRTWL